MYHNTEPALSVGFSSNNTLPGNISHIERSYWVICSLQAPFVVLQLLSSKQITAGVGFTNLFFFFFNFCTCPTSHWIPLRSLFQVILTNMLSSYCLPDTMYLLVSRSPLLLYKPTHSFASGTEWTSLVFQWVFKMWCLVSHSHLVPGSCRLSFNSFHQLTILRATRFLLLLPRHTLPYTPSSFP